MQKLQSKVSLKSKVPSTSPGKILEIVIKIFYKTEIGQDLYISGESSKLGNWNKINLGLPLKWTKDHIWTGRFTPKDLPKLSNFKFIVKEKDDSITWEGGEDRIFDISKLTYAMKNSQNLKTQGWTELEKERVHLELDSSKSVLTLSYKWEH